MDLLISPLPDGDAVSALWGRLRKPIANLHERLADPEATFQASSVGKVGEEMSKLEMRGYSSLADVFVKDVSNKFCESVGERGEENV